MPKMIKELVIKVPWGGLGDHLLHSHLPKIAKSSRVELPINTRIGKYLVIIQTKEFNDDRP